MGPSLRQRWGKLVLVQAENVVVMESNQENPSRPFYSAVEFSRVSRNEEDRRPVCLPAQNKPVPQSNDGDANEHNHIPIHGRRGDGNSNGEKAKHPHHHQPGHRTNVDEDAHLA
jgi:hypothetical protein